MPLVDLAVHVDPTDDAAVSRAIDRYPTDPAALAAARAHRAAFLDNGRWSSWNGAARRVRPMAERGL